MKNSKIEIRGGLIMNINLKRLVVSSVVNIVLVVCGIFAGYLIKCALL